MVSLIRELIVVLGIFNYFFSTSHNPYLHIPYMVPCLTFSPLDFFATPIFKTTLKIKAGFGMLIAPVPELCILFYSYKEIDFMLSNSASKRPTVMTV